MPTYTLTRKIDTQRREACEFLALLFSHTDNMNLTITGVSSATSGGTKGTVTVTISQTLSADQLAHFGLS